MHLSGVSRICFKTYARPWDHRAVMKFSQDSWESLKTLAETLLSKDTLLKHCFHRPSRTGGRGVGGGEGRGASAPSPKVLCECALFLRSPLNVLFYVNTKEIESHALLTHCHTWSRSSVSRQSNTIWFKNHRKKIKYSLKREKAPHRLRKDTAPGNSGDRALCLKLLDCRRDILVNHFR